MFSSFEALRFLHSCPLCSPANALRSPLSFFFHCVAEKLHWEVATRNFPQKVVLQGILWLVLGMFGGFCEACIEVRDLLPGERCKGRICFGYIFLSVLPKIYFEGGINPPLLAP